MGQITSSSSSASPACPLRLDEYNWATREFFSDAVNAVARASDPILGQIHTEKVEVIPPSVNTMESGQIVRHDPLVSSAAVTFSISAGVQGDFSDVHKAIAESAEQLVSSIMPRIFEQISEICDATGNVVSGAGRPVWDAMLETLETIEIAFDEDGNPSLPSIVMHPDMAEKIGEPPEGYQERCNDIIARRRDEWLARRRSRRLPRSGR